MERRPESLTFPTGWRLVTSDSLHYRMNVRTEGGRPYLVLARPGAKRGDYGMARQVLDARPHRGRRLEFTARLRHLSGAGAGWSNMWLNITDARQHMLRNESLNGERLTADSWQPGSLVVDVPAQADSITLGFMLIGSGETWVSDAALRDLGRAGEGDEPPRPLTDRGLVNLVAFTRLLGYVRFFDPADSVAATDWDAFAVAAVDSAEVARNPEELVAVLGRMFRPLDPSLRIETSRVTLVSNADSKATGIVSWSHHGWAAETDTSRIYWSRRDTVDAGSVEMQPGPARSITADLGGGVWCAVPTSLWLGDRGTVPVSTTPRWRSAPRPRGYVPTGDDRSTRLADVALCWSLLQHFYPYFDVVHADWDGALREALKAAARDEGRQPFLRTLQRLTAHLDDGHARAWTSDEQTFFRPFAWSWVEDRLVVTAVDDSAATGLERGDIVIAIDGRSTEQVYATDAAPFVSAATEGWRRQRSLALMARGNRDSLALEVERADGSRRRLVVPAARRSAPEGLERPAPIAQLRPGIWYVDVERVNDERFTSARDTLAHARGLIYDVRGYPYHLGTEPLAHLTDSTLVSGQWYVPRVLSADHRDPVYAFSHWTVAPQSPRFPARVAFLIDPQAISYSETWLGIAEAFHLGTFVGEPTAGTNGNVNQVRFPGGYSVLFTGMKVLKQDGSLFHGVGIHPTIAVSPTLSGIRSGIDEQLQRALEVVDH